MYRIMKYIQPSSSPLNWVSALFAAAIPLFFLALMLSSEPFLISKHLSNSQMVFIRASVIFQLCYWAALLFLALAMLVNPKKIKEKMIDKQRALFVFCMSYGFLSIFMYGVYWPIQSNGWLVESIGLVLIGLLEFFLLAKSCEARSTSGDIS
jgi:hypothetical protein